MKQKTIAIDLDGTLSQYNGWKGSNHIGEPIPGAKEFCQKLIENGYHVTIFSARDHSGPIWSWLVQHRFPPEMDVSILKPKALAYIDDRAINPSCTGPMVTPNWDAVYQMIQLLEKKHP